MALGLIKDQADSNQPFKTGSQFVYPISKNIPNGETIQAIEETLSSKNPRSFRSVAEMKVYLKQMAETDE